jgi:hypothetical protein
MAVITLEQSYLNDLIDTLHSELCALRALSGLMNGHDDSCSVNINELPCLIDPIIERQESVLDGMKQLVTKTQ